MDTDKTYFTTDTIDSTIYAVDEDGNEVSKEDFSWDEQTTVTIDSDLWEHRFETDEFYKLEYSVAKPLEQTYVINDEEYVFAKPRDELKKAGWKLDNLPWTIRHPDTGSVMDADDVNGFWRDPHYNDDLDEQRLHLYLPTNNDDGLEFVDEYQATSVGFTNKLVLPDNYDGEIGGDVDLDNVDALQTDIHYDHVASVEKGRYPTSKGGGLVLDSSVSLAKEIDTSAPPHREGQDAMQLADNGCNGGEEVGSSHEDGFDEQDNELPNATLDTNMTDDIADMNLDAIAEANDDVSEVLETKDELEQRVEALDDKKSELEQRIEATEDTVSALKDELGEYKMSERQELVDDLTDLTDYWDEEDMLDPEGPSLDTLEERIEMMDSLLDETQETTTVDNEGATESGEGGSSSTSGPMDLSNTA